MTRHQLTTLAAFGSFLLLGGAYAFQAMGYPPCQMCFWQRWPHMAAIGIGVLAFFITARAWAWLGAIAATITSGIGVFHTGVEKGWWEGPSSCTGGGLDLTDGADLLSVAGDKLIMCDQVSWAFLGLSMASWNALFSFGLMFVWLAAARKQ